MRWETQEKVYETVAAYVAVIQRNAFVLVAAGVVLHQHTRLLMHDLREYADGMSEEDVRAGMRQLNSEIGAAERAAGVGLVEVQQVIAERSSGPKGKAAVEGRVAAANARIAGALCGCEVCEGVAMRIRGQSRVAKGEHSGAAAAVVKRRAAGTGCQETGAVIVQPQQSTTVAQPPTRQQRERERKKANKRRKKKAALGARQAGEVGEKDPQKNETALEASETNSQAARGASRVLKETFEDTLLGPTTAATLAHTLLGPTGAAEKYEERQAAAAVSTNKEKQTAAVSTKGESSHQ